MTLYKALNGLESCHGGSATWTPGRWMPWVRELIPCEQGYHVCDGERQLWLWLASDVWVADVKDEIIRCDDKVVVHQARIVEKTAWNIDRAVRFAEDCVDHIKHIERCHRIGAIEHAVAAARHRDHGHVFSTTVWEAVQAVFAAVNCVAYVAPFADCIAVYHKERQWQTERLGKYLRGEL